MRSADAQMLSAPSTVALNTAFICWHITVALLATISDAGQNISIASSSCQNLLGQTTLSFIWSHSRIWSDCRSKLWHCPFSRLFCSSWSNLLSVLCILDWEYLPHLMQYLVIGYLGMTSTSGKSTGWLPFHARSLWAAIQTAVILLEQVAGQ